MPVGTIACVIARTVACCSHHTLLFFLIILHSSYIAYGMSVIFTTISMASMCALASVFYRTTLLAVPTPPSRHCFWASIRYCSSEESETQGGKLITLYLSSHKSNILGTHFRSLRSSGYRNLDHRTTRRSRPLSCPSAGPLPHRQPLRFFS
jgi:hypothetical protein